MKKRVESYLTRRLGLCDGEVVDELLQLVRGALPEEKVGCTDNYVEYGELRGWNLCLEEVKKRLGADE